MLEVEVEWENWQICNFVSYPKSHPHIYVYIWCVFPAKRLQNCHILNKVETMNGSFLQKRVKSKLTLEFS